VKDSKLGSKVSKQSHLQNQPCKGVFVTTLFCSSREGSQDGEYNAAKRTEIDRSDNNVFLGDLGPGAHALNGSARFIRRFVRLSQYAFPSHSSQILLRGRNRSACFLGRMSRVCQTWLMLFFFPFLLLLPVSLFVIPNSKHPSPSETAQPLPSSVRMIAPTAERSTCIVWVCICV
jgi:hypothetical protein